MRQATTFGQTSGYIFPDASLHFAETPDYISLTTDYIVSRKNGQLEITKIYVVLPVYQ